MKDGNPGRTTEFRRFLPDSTSEYFGVSFGMGRSKGWEKVVMGRIRRRSPIDKGTHCYHDYLISLCNGDTYV